MAKHEKDKSFELLHIDGTPEDDPNNKLLDNLVLDTRMAYKNYKNFSYYNILDQDVDVLDEQIELNKLLNKETPIKNAKIIVYIHGDKNGYISQDASSEILYVIFKYLNENKHIKTMEINLTSCYGATKSKDGRDILQDLKHKISKMFPNIDFFFQKTDRHYQTNYAFRRNKRTNKVTNMIVKAKLREYYHIKNGKMVNFGDRQFTYMEFRDKGGVMPAIFAVDNDGYEKVVNFRMINQYIAIEGVNSVYTLRYGRDTVCVFNEALRGLIRNLTKVKK